MTTKTTTTTLPAGIYVRISLDKHDGAGVERQEEMCRKLAAEHGLEVTRVYSDNSISAYSGKTHPGPGASYLDEAAQEDDLDAIGARIARGGGGVEGIKTADNRDENYDVTGTPGMPGFDY